ncbi:MULTISPECIES: phosphomannomutase/phosphoglucomutase [Micromonospora]|uniref:Phosphomannomutase/phosphoglucomutase n=1 Tax=Micromonospora gifhornensis TaxID=84594 RepID=A0ABQ4I8A4_9ACTN|nr:MULTISPECIES: phosphomannomutase/phosphoglucomutase [Micromonospora]PMR60556.1 phosphomannomutase/phosphoglucomutase [Verrucosispora sp. ts21]GIJ14137.1 phosphomannomutase/phosphoglucomutase [Micromonospora gifhornensis]
MSDLSQIVKAYDVRGTVPQQWDEGVAAALGSAFAQMLDATGDAGKAVLIGHDMRASGPALAAAFATGVRAEGRAVIEIGLASTDMIYYASGSLDLPGAMFTASHNPAQYNGIKMCHAGARPVGQDTGLAEVRERAQALLDKGEPVGEPTAPVHRQDLLADYAAHLRTLVDLSGIRPLTVVVDAGNGMAGHTVPSVLGDAALAALPLRIVPMYFELDGTFPNHEANPLDPANLVDLQRAVVAHGADIGLAFDGDADRCFVIDERGEPVSPSAITALVAARELAKHPGSTVIHNLITSQAVPEIIREHGGEPVVARVGHSFIKAEMARTNAIFGGEHSAHYYFRDFWFADTGMLAAMHTLAALGEQPQPLSVLGAEYERYVASGEINSTVTDQAAKVAEVRAAYPDAEVDELDGLTLRFPDGAWFNLRASNTEPLLRLNVEAPTVQRMTSLRDDVLDRVRR